MRWVVGDGVGDRAITGSAASASQMGRFETKWLSRPENLAALADLPGQWIDKVQQRRPPRTIVLDMDSSESPTYGEQEGRAYNGHFGCTCHHPLFVFNQLGDLERCALRPGNVQRPMAGGTVLEPVVSRYRGSVKRLYFRGDAAFAIPEIYEFLEAEGIGCTIRLPANRVLQDKIGYPLKRSGRPTTAGSAPLLFQLQLPGRIMEQAATSGGKGRVAPGELYPRVGFIVTNLARPAERVVAFYNHRGTASSGSRKARARSSGPGCHVAPSPPTWSASNFTPWRTISATSCGRWRCRKRRSRGR